MKDKTELIFGYGSLMSFRGFYRNGLGILKDVNILNAFRAQIKGHRGFAKPSYKKIYCMDIDNFELKGSVIRNEPEQGYIEGLIIKINQRDFPVFCNREGYTKGNKLKNYTSNYISLGKALWNL